MEISKQDWKLYREKIGAWQESYMDRLLAEYIAIIQKDTLPSERFWELEKRLRSDKRKKGVVLEMSKQNVIYDLVSLINDGVIVLADLDVFSDDLQDAVKYFIERTNIDDI